MDNVEANQKEPTNTNTFSFTTLKHIPISVTHLKAITQVLTEHGATLKETRDFPNSDPAQAYKEFTITFPAGTIRSFGLRMRRSCPFVIRFPDGYHLHVGELWPLWETANDTSTTVLYLPQEQQQKGETRD
jgi:hypothetical protein